MPPLPHEFSAQAEADRLVARMAISWFDLDAVRVDEVLLAAADKYRRGIAPDVLLMLCDARLLTPSQAENIRQGQEPTRVDMNLNAESLGKPSRSDGFIPVRADAEPTQMGEYRILRLLGQGGMGAVYFGFDPTANRQVAIKVLDADQSAKQNLLGRFQREGQHGAKLAHANIVRTLAMGQDSATHLHFIVLEYIDGPSAHELVDRERRLKVGDALHIILDIARALEYAHKNQIIHRDIKPSNILITSAGLAKLSDLGLAKHRDDTSNLTHATQGIGTPYYMPYEQAINAKRADERSDIYALGATLFHLVTGEVPFSGESSLEIVEKKNVGYYATASSMNPEVSSKLENILAKMLARNPEDRYQTVSDVIVDIERSQLASALPSFVHLDSALRDPVVRRRLTAPLEATQPDLRAHQALKNTPADPIWLMRFEDADGVTREVEATTNDILDQLRAGTIPLNAQVAKPDQAKYKSLIKWPVFQMQVATLKKRESSHRKKHRPPRPNPEVNLMAWWFAGLALGVGVVVTIVAVAWALLAR